MIAMLIAIPFAASFRLDADGLTICIWMIPVRKISWNRVTGVQMLNLRPEEKKRNSNGKRRYHSCFLVTIDHCPFFEVYGEDCEEKDVRHHVRCYPLRSVCYYIPNGMEAEYEHLLCHYRKKEIDLFIPKS